MKPEDDEPTPSDDELREAQALAAALEPGATVQHEGGAAGAPGDALETASLLRHARAPLVVPPAHEPIAAAHIAPTLDARRSRGRRRARLWIGASLIAPAAAVASMLFFLVRPTMGPRPPYAPPPPADLLAAQADATRGGSQASAALATLELKMRAYRRQYHDGLRRRGGDQP